MAASLATVLPRVAALVVIWLLATSTITFAAAGRPLVTAKPPAPAAPEVEETLVVPDVRRQAYVFAKGILDDAGFAWRVKGTVKGYAVNTVASQSPAAGTRVVDNGAPTIVLRLARSADYEERGLPESASPHAGTKVVLPSDVAPAAGAAEKAAPQKAPAKDAPADDDAGDAERPQPTKKDAKKDPAPADEPRKPDFEVPGAPPEPRDEMPLTDRARLLERRVAAHSEPTGALAKYWLYQHAWIVTGARFGWHDGAEALRILIRVDEDVQARRGFGPKSEALTPPELAEVQSKAGHKSRGSPPGKATTAATPTTS
ncbi:MAG: PASTA domain-containing protein [Actinobacteria bacterium]|nr:PASTA domain-containing protein [Actinomycetota bacterium]